MGRSRISQKLGMSGLKLTEPSLPPLERLNQQAPQPSDPPDQLIGSQFRADCRAIPTELLTQAAVF